MALYVGELLLAQLSKFEGHCAVSSMNDLSSAALQALQVAESGYGPDSPWQVRWRAQTAMVDVLLRVGRVEEARRRAAAVFAEANELDEVARAQAKALVERCSQS